MPLLIFLVSFSTCLHMPPKRRCARLWSRVYLVWGDHVAPHKHFAKGVFLLASKYCKGYNYLASCCKKISRYSNRAVSHFYSVKISVLGHYLPVSLSSFRSCVNFIQSDFTVPTPQCRKVFDEAAAISICSSRRVFMARNCPEWCVDT